MPFFTKDHSFNTSKLREKLGYTMHITPSAFPPLADLPLAESGSPGRKSVIKLLCNDDFLIFIEIKIEALLSLCKTDIR
jgi:hypothetical protein